MRSLCRYLRQTDLGFSDGYLADVLAANPRAARLLVDLFDARFDPQRHPDLDAPDREPAVAVEAALLVEIDAVTSLDEDRILRALTALLVRSIARTNAFQSGPDGVRKPEVVFKLDPRELPFLPRPRPRYEIWVYSPRTEGVHLRGGFVAVVGSDGPTGARTSAPRSSGS